MWQYLLILVRRRYQSRRAVLFVWLYCRQAAADIVSDVLLSRAQVLLVGFARYRIIHRVHKTGLPIKWNERVILLLFAFNGIEAHFIIITIVLHSWLDGLTLVQRRPKIDCPRLLDIGLGGIRRKLIKRNKSATAGIIANFHEIVGSNGLAVHADVRKFGCVFATVEAVLGGALINLLNAIFCRHEFDLQFIFGVEAIHRYLRDVPVDIPQHYRNVFAAI